MDHTDTPRTNLDPFVTYNLTGLVMDVRRDLNQMQDSLEDIANDTTQTAAVREMAQVVFGMLDTLRPQIQTAYTQRV